MCSLKGWLRRDDWCLFVPLPSTEAPGRSGEVAASLKEFAAHSFVCPVKIPISKSVTTSQKGH